MTADSFASETIDCVSHVYIYLSGEEFDPHRLERALGEPGGKRRMAGVSPPSRRKNSWIWSTPDWRGALSLEEHFGLILDRFRGAEATLRSAPGATTRHLVVFLNVPTITGRDGFVPLVFPPDALTFALAAQLQLEVWPAWRR